MKPVEYAITYAEKKGWKIHPCRRDKTPYLKDWPNKASNNPDQIIEWWNEWPDASIGLKCGPESGVWVVDIDLPDGPDTISRLEFKHETLPATLQQTTGSGGIQLFFHYNGTKIRNSSRKVGPGVDVRGDGGYVILPPSGHPTGGFYKWNGKGEILKAPDWLVNLAKSQPVKSFDHIQATEYGTTKYGEHALIRELAGLSCVGEGSRNDSLNRAAFNIGQLIAGNEIEYQHGYNALIGHGLAIGLNHLEVKNTVESGLKAGMTNPRSANNDFYYKTDKTDKTDSFYNEPEKRTERTQTDTKRTKTDSERTETDSKKRYSLSSDIEQWVTNSTGCFTASDVDREFGLADRRGRQTRSNIMASLKKNNIIREDARQKGKYWVIDSKVEWIDLDAPAEESFDIKLPFNLHEHLIIPSKAIIVLAGSTNAGKTAFILNTLRLNRTAEYEKLYLMSEMGAGEYISRVRNFGDPMDEWKQIKAASKSYDFDGTIQHHNPDGLTCVDYLEERDGEYYKITSDIRAIYDSIKTGVAMVAIQKLSTKDVGRGGEGTMEKARLYMTLDFLCAREHSIICALKLVKVKCPVGKNLQNSEIHFEISNGCNIDPITDWMSSYKVDRKKCIMEYEGAKRLADTEDDEIPPVYLNTKTGKHVRIIEKTMLQWAESFYLLNIPDELTRMAKTSHEWLNEKGYFHQISGALKKRHDKILETKGKQV